MANELKQISDLTSGAITNDNDVFIMDTYEGVTVKIPYSVLRSAIANAITPSINVTSKHWYIGSTDTGVVAEGQNGAQGQQGVAGNDGASISFATAEITGGHSVTISSTDTSVEDRTFNVMNGNDGYSISATSSTITGGHRVTIHSTDPTVSDTYFDVMDGTGGGTTYTPGDGIDITNNEISAKLGSGLQINSTTENIDVVGKQSQITQSSTLTLTVVGWDSTTKQQTVTFAHDTALRNVIDITPSEMPTWAESKVYAISETSSGITFQCSTVPASALTFKVTSMEVST